MLKAFLIVALLIAAVTGFAVGAAWSVGDGSERGVMD